MNKHIVEFLENYIGLSNNPEYAVMLKGEWGCGKTWFIKSFIKKLIADKKLKKSEIIYISTYGIQNIEQLEMEFVKAVHPLLNNDSFSIINTLAKGITSGNFDIQQSAGELAKKRLKESDLIKRLIIVDDLERSDLEPNVILGYLSSLIIDKGIRVIIIANEDEYVNKNLQLKQSYLKIREKLIAYRFEIKPNFNDAIKCFLNEINLVDEKYFQIVSDVIDKLEIKNLRVIRQALINYYYIISKVSKEILSDCTEYIYLIFEANLVLFTQFALGEIGDNENNSIDNALSCYYKYNKSLKKFNEENKKSDIWTLMYLGKIPLNNCWKDIIINGIYDVDLINSNVKEDNRITTEDEQDNIYYILNNFYSLTPSELEEVINRVEKEFEEGRYTYIGDVLHIYNLWALFVREGIINKDEQQLDSWFTEIINKNKNSLIGDKINLSSGYNGFAYNETEKFNKFRKVLIDIAEENNYRIMKDKIKDEISTEFDLRVFIDNLNWKNNSENEPKYYEIPILNMISIDELFSKLINDTIQNQSLFVHALKKRYGVIYTNGILSEKYFSEFEAVKKIYNLYNEHLNKISSLYNTNVIRYRHFIKEYEEIINYMKKQIQGIE